jgi:cytochrome c553
MSKLTAICLASVLGVASLQVMAAGNVEQGKAKSFVCVVCHGPEGRNPIPMLGGGIANLGGMDPARFVSAMKAYRYGQRFHPFMEFFVIPLTDQDMEDLAAYYASLGQKQ